MNNLERIKANAHTLAVEFDWLELLIQTRIKKFFQTEGNGFSCDILPPDLSDHCSYYASFIKDNSLNDLERLSIIIALAPVIRPSLLNYFFLKDSTTQKVFSEFGGVIGPNQTGFLPTIATVAFLLSENLTDRLLVYEFFNNEHFLFKQQILLINREQGGEMMHGKLAVSPEYRHYFLIDQPFEPDYNHSFPAKRIQSSLEWEDLVVTEDVRMELEEIRTWISKKDEIMANTNLNKRLRKGYRSLFYGPPGTGKTLAASLLGKVTGYKVYRIDLSMIVSKYIGETEKNLAGIFDQAESKNWILFFDEADALFGKRTETSDSKDRHANQEVAYLLQRIEDFDGVILLATNLKSNLDAAFARRFQSTVYFPIPEKSLRLKLWQENFAGTYPIDPNVKWQAIAKEYEIAGGSIINVLRYCTLAALSRKEAIIMSEDIHEGIRRELRKSGKTI